MTIDLHIRNLRSESARLRAASLRELARSKDAAAFEPISDLLAVERDPNVRQLGIRSLGRIGDRRAVNILLCYFDQHQAAVTKALYHLGVFDGALNGVSGRVRRAVKRALQVAKPELKQLIAEDRVTSESLFQVLPPIM